MQIFKKETFDAIVVGTVISRLLAAKRLCEKGLETLLFGRGPMLRHIEDYPTLQNDSSAYKYKAHLPEGKYLAPRELHKDPNENTDFDEVETSLLETVRELRILVQKNSEVIGG